MSLSLKACAEYVRSLEGKAADVVEQFLRLDTSLDATDRITVKIALDMAANRRRRLAASGELATDQAEIRLGSLATDINRPGQGGRSEAMPVPPELERLMTRAGLRAGEAYDVATLDQALDRVGITDVATRVAIKHTLLEASRRTPATSKPGKTSMRASGKQPIRGCTMQIKCSDWDPR